MFAHIGSGCTQLPPDSPSGLRFGFDLLCRRQEVTMRVRYKQATVEGSIRRWDGIGWYTMVWNVDGWQWEVLALADPQTNKQINKRLANRPRRDCRTFAQKGKTIELNWQQRTGTTGIWVGWWCRSAGSGGQRWCCRSRAAHSTGNGVDSIKHASTKSSRDMRTGMIPPKANLFTALG